MTAMFVMCLELVMIVVDYICGNVAYSNIVNLYSVQQLLQYLFLELV
jgi:hypothetical protein